MSKKLLKNMFRKVRTANIKYGLIESGDKVAVAMSGGKDSLALLFFLNLLKKRTPVKFELCPIYLDLGWDNEIAPLESFCTQMDLPLLTEHTNIGKIVFEVREEKHPCALCSSLRRGALNRVAKVQGCNKVALGHHMDDVVNTMFLSMLFEGRYNVFKPKTYLDRMDITLIRPFIYIEEKEIKSFIQYQHLKPVKNNCPADGQTKRNEINQLLDMIQEQFPDARRKFLSSIENIGPGTFWG